MSLHSATILSTPRRSGVGIELQRTSVSCRVARQKECVQYSVQLVGSSTGHRIGGRNLFYNVLRYFYSESRQTLSSNFASLRLCNWITLVTVVTLINPDLVVHVNTTDTAATAGVAFSPYLPPSSRRVDTNLTFQRAGRATFSWNHFHCLDI